MASDSSTAGELHQGMMATSSRNPLVEAMADEAEAGYDVEEGPSWPGRAPDNGLVPCFG